MSIMSTNTYKLDCGCRFPISEKGLQQRGKPLSWYEKEGIVPPIVFRAREASLDCPAVWDMLGQGLTKGVFQLESALGRHWCKRLKPQSVSDLAALGALLRPGCLEAVDENGVSVTEHYCRRKNKEAEAIPLHPCLESSLTDTHQLMIYQEQCMSTARIAAGFTLQEADVLRKSIGKKIPEEMEKCRIMFLEGSKKVGLVNDKDAEMIFSYIEKSQRYGFNRCSHKDTIIRRTTRNCKHGPIKYTVEHMFRVRNDIDYAKGCGQLSLYKKWKLYENYGKGLSLCEDGRIRPNTILDIRFAGVQKTYRLTLETGESICVTGNHKFPTPDGERKLEDLKVGDRLYVCGDYEKTNFNQYSFSDFTNADRKSKAGISGTGTVGSENRWFTNGSYTDYKINSQLLPKSCNRCGTPDGRLEVHHINGDRANSKFENLERLCVSCHKKTEYANGRVKRGEKGYPHHLVRIQSIEFFEEANTYDVTMEGPHHNFVTEEGIVTCNSHALSYAISGYWSAFSKAHFPVQFFTSWLRFAREKKAHRIEEVKQLIREAKYFGIDIYTPDFLTLQKYFHTDGHTINFGLLDVKGIGLAQYEKLKEAAQYAKEFTGKELADLSFYEFLIIVTPKCSASVLEKLINVGALRNIKDAYTPTDDCRIEAVERDMQQEAREVGDSKLSQTLLFS